MSDEPVKPHKQEASDVVSEQEQAEYERILGYTGGPTAGQLARYCASRPTFELTADGKRALAEADREDALAVLLDEMNAVAFVESIVAESGATDMESIYQATWDAVNDYAKRRHRPINAKEATTIANAIGSVWATLKGKERAA